jgi:hypothetical protein
MHAFRLPATQADPSPAPPALAVAAAAAELIKVPSDAATCVHETMSQQQVRL